MPSKNIVRSFSSNSFYHIYNRGADKQIIFRDDADYRYFSNLFSRHLGPKATEDKYGREYKFYGDKIDAIAFCWMPNHYHLLVFQKDEERTIVELMQSVGTAYTMYFNKKYRRRGRLFETHYKSSLIDDDSYFAHISRYIHLNPQDYKKWPHSSYHDYVSTPKHDWINSEYILNDFQDKQAYQAFVADYEAMKKDLDTIKKELADG